MQLSLCSLQVSRSETLVRKVKLITAGLLRVFITYLWLQVVGEVSFARAKGLHLQIKR